MKSGLERIAKKGRAPLALAYLALVSTAPIAAQDVDTVEGSSCAPTVVVVALEALHGEINTTDASVSTCVGEVVGLSFASQPGTGFEWSLTSDVLGPLRALDDNEAAPFDDLDGGHAIQTFRFAAEAEGSVTLIFAYGRAWMPNDPARIATVQVSVGP